MPEAAALLARLDAAIRELLELRVAVEGLLCGTTNLPDDADDDLADANLLDTHAAQERFVRVISGGFEFVLV